MSKLSSNTLIPNEFLKDLTATVHTQSNGHYEHGKWAEGSTTDIAFKGCILPMTYRDLHTMNASQDGMFSVNDKKLYAICETTFLNETKIKDGDKTYKVYTAKDYDIVNPNLKIYYIKKIDKVEA